MITKQLKKNHNQPMNKKKYDKQMQVEGMVRYLAN